MDNIDRRLAGADFIRASACFVVLLHHLAQRVDGRSALGAFAPIQLFNNGGGFGVGMFFVLSGFLLARPFWQALDQGAPLPSLRVYAIRRAARILPGFWMALTLSLILSITVFAAVPNIWLFLRYLAGLFLISDWHWTTLFPVEVNGPLWSIAFEVSSYVMLPMGFAALFALGHGRLRGWAARLAWLAVIAAALGGHALFVSFVAVDPADTGWQYGLQGGAKTWMPWFNPFGFFAMFAVGALAGGVQVLLSRFISLWFDALAVLALAATVWFFWTTAMEGPGEFFGLLRVPYGFPTFHLLLGAALAVMPSSVLVAQVEDNRVVRYLARISFGIYIYHYLVLEMVRVFLMPGIDHGQIGDTGTLLAASTIIIGATILIATASYRWLEAPVITWARELEGRRLTTAALA